MGELQIALLILGAMVIIAVIIYNRVQEARFRERAEDAFAPAQKEALDEAHMARPAAVHERIEPQFQNTDVPVHGPQEPRADIVSAPTAQEVETARAVVTTSFEPVEVAGDPLPEHRPEPVSEPAAMLAPVEPALSMPPQAVDPVAAEDDDDPLSYVARISAHEPLPAAAVDQMLRSMIGQTDRVLVEGRRESGSQWHPVEAGHVPADLRELRASLQLVDRRGMVTQHDIAQFQSAVARCAGTARASSNLPQAEPFLARTRELDRFCAEVDVVVGMNVVAPRGRPFAGTRVRGLIEAAGFKSAEDRFVHVDNANNLRFSLENQDQSPLTADALRNAQVQGLTLLLDVPRQADGLSTFNQMVQVGRQLAQSLGGTLVDDNGSPVTDAGLEQIRNQLRAIYRTMESRGMPPGSTLAGRLFG
jgi:FtsZ-interacting cell division protein ZipA